MKTCCPNCQTIFRVTAEHLKVQLGNVRCGQCKEVFNALDSLIDENSTPTVLAPMEQEEDIPEESGNSDPIYEESADDGEKPADAEIESAPDIDAPETRVTHDHQEEAPEAENTSDQISIPTEPQIPEAHQWSQDMLGYMEKPMLSRRARTLYLISIITMTAVLAAQLVFYLRSEIAIAKPPLRPYLQWLSALAGDKLTFPQHSELISIETSDLHKAPSGNGQLILGLTLRNRANYAQELPAIELSLTDVQESVIARRILMPDDYLPPDMSTKRLFDANTDIPIQLWIETKDLDPAGYRLYVFYS